jgi:hypothetical protein
MLYVQRPASRRRAISALLQIALQDCTQPDRYDAVLLMSRFPQI